MRVIILAAGIGKRLGNTIRLPKCLIEINGETLLERYLKILFHYGLKDITLVVGYQQAKIIERLKNIEVQGLWENLKTIYNKNYSEGSILSLYEARKELIGNVLIMDGDL